MPYFVNMIDKAMSGWGKAAKGKARYSIQCDTLEQAEAIERAALARSEMRYVTISNAPPRPRPGDTVTQRHAYNLGGPWLAYWKGEHPKEATREEA